MSCTGKTLQALVGVAVSHANAEKHTGERTPISLIICPSSVVGHWIAEIDKFFPDKVIFRSLCLPGSSSVRKIQMKSIPDGTNVLVTSYAVLRSDVEFFSNREWQVCVLDEGHLLKNPATGTRHW
jgi:TATA-binding protein-associated factor